MSDRQSLLRAGDVIRSYDRQAPELTRCYESLSFEQAHAELLAAIPRTPGLMLDVGAGSGRDAAWFAGRNWEAIAVEPAAGMRQEGSSRHPSGSIKWVDDRLPGLDVVHGLGLGFDLIWLSAVWMHVAPADRQRAFRKLVTLLKPGGRLLMTLRHGPSPPDRPMFETSLAEIEDLALEHGLLLARAAEGSDGLGRKDVRWSHVALQLPDDATGALPLLRGIVLNDSKSSTYKLALLRTLVRVAESAGALARPVDDEHVALPLGLVALYWVRAFKPLLAAGLPQTPSNRGLEGLGFVREGFRALAPISPFDLRIGAFFAESEAEHLTAAIGDAARTIARMPATYITFADGTPILPAHPRRLPRARGPISIDADYLLQFGELWIPRDLWNALRRLGVWIEPMILSEWIRLMQSYGVRQGRELATDRVSEALTWLDPVRETRVVRMAVIAALEAGEPIRCVWSGRRLDARCLDIDHCLPWVAWPCGDLWNLLPATREVNQRLKRHKLVSSGALTAARPSILEWWQRGYRGGEPMLARRFAREASAALPVTAAPENDGFLDDVFTGLEYQRMRLRHDQQLEEWPGCR